MANGMVPISVYVGLGEDAPQRVAQIAVPLKLEVGFDGRAAAYVDLKQLSDTIRAAVLQTYEVQTGGEPE